MNSTVLHELADETPDFKRLGEIIEKNYLQYCRHLRQIPDFNDFSDDFIYYFNSHLHEYYEELGDQELLYEHVRDALMNRRYVTDRLFPQREVW